MRALLIAAGLAISSAAGAADAPSVSQSTAPDTSVTTIVTDAKPSEQKLAAARDMIDASHVLDNFNQLIDVLWQAESRQLKAAHPEIDDAELSAVEKLIQDAFVAHQEEYKQLIARLYADHLSEGDLRALAAFYRTDAGKHYVAAMPAMLKDMSVVGMNWAQTVLEELRPKIMEEVRKRKAEHQ